MTIDSTAALARVAAAEGSHDEARERCRMLLGEWEGTNDHHYAIAGLRWAASFFAGRGDARGVRECADALSRMASETGHSDALAARGVAHAENGGLSRRELEVVRLLSVGRTNREIARQLFLSRRTVDMHVRNILRKLDCRSRVEAAHRAGELGLLVA